jgi:hypothetical protein
MPWTKEDVEKHKKGLTDKQKELWVEVANDALRRCEEKGQGDCEGRAIRQANSVVGRTKEAFEIWFEGLEPEMQELVEDHIHGLKSALAKERKARKEAENKLREQAIEEAEIIGDIVPLIEKALLDDGLMAVKIIEPGWGTSGYYSPEVLERDGPTLFTAGTQMFIDHPTETEERERPERSVRDLAGELTEDAIWDPYNAFGPGLYGKAKPVGEFAEVLDELAPHIGVSINARGRAKEGEAEGKEGPIIQEITAARSIDFVTVPGAGGQILELYEAARKNAPRKKKREVNMPNEKELQEALDRKTADYAELEKETARLREAVVLGKAKDFVGGMLADQDIPELTRARLTASLSKNPPIKEGELDEKAYEEQIGAAVKSEMAYLVELTGSGRIEGMGGGGPPDTDEKDLQKLEESWKQKYETDGFDADTAAQMAKISVRGR